MSRKILDEKDARQSLKEMLQDRKPDEPAEKILATFCQRYSLDMATCRSFYHELVRKGEIKEK
jgi:hypothetical protein